ncbi:MULTISPECIES: lysozyme inhibitor LprI family protein [unclassified Mesorhizobium]|uniref:lysozyme inhibitor LprI family protein n=1 Tax=unclassified Mesorhizobium TaxID=325217 RepID=UPI0006FF4BB8|nr:MULTISPECIES: lysozyme inhibitor LprI family protein [unclassified Mesorhizobium]KQZ13404.1 urease-associated protein [Mesorhizobium sp. Root1471]KQZ35916.1 urease-associated protein [Mesorhizobium sp. Root554]MDR7032245.1 uncharacterized protein YecT (DUF1311 family) [Mesorhizobium sp. BE184]
MRTLLFALPALALMALSSTAARAEDCTEAPDQMSANECADKAYQASDAELNKLYKQIEGRLKDDADTRKLLVTAQKAWIGFRDAECDFSSSGVAEGSAYPATVSMCLDGITQGRIDTFRGYLDCEEGDMSCPVPAAN